MRSGGGRVSWWLVRGGGSCRGLGLVMGEYLLHLKLHTRLGMREADFWRFRIVKTGYVEEYGDSARVVQHLK